MSENERLARLEARTDEQERRLESIEKKLDRLLEFSAYGKSSIRVLLLVGSVLAALGAVVAWLFEKFN
tara:strand:- start:1559 stop:1762 length:204 start_codon:yes stop_codon:yes gene_type:complete